MYFIWKSLYSKLVILIESGAERKLTIRCGCVCVHVHTCLCAHVDMQTPSVIFPISVTRSSKQGTEA